jgi:hypothetical protein
MSEAAAEVIHIQNAFGTVTDRRVIYFRSKGWFSDGSKEIVSLQRVTSVRLEISRPFLLAIPLLLLGLILLRGNSVLATTGGAAIALAVLLLWGSLCCANIRSSRSWRESIVVMQSTKYRFGMHHQALADPMPG